MIAWVDVRSSPEPDSALVNPDDFWHLAVQRMERCIRPVDQVCMLGQSRLAVCMGDGAYRVSPRALGARLARAMGDRLSVGTTELDLQVSVGIGTAQSDIEPATLSSAALSSVRTTQRSASKPGDNTPGVPRGYVAVTEVPDRSNNPTRLDKRSLLALVSDDPHDGGPAGSAWTYASPADFASSAVRGMRVLLVDPHSDTDEKSRPAVEVVAAAARSYGAWAIVSRAGDPGSVASSIATTEPAVVVVVLQLEPSRRSGNGDTYKAWEEAARLVRSVRDRHVPVIALSMGASAAALAACVEQGATGLFDLDLLAYELSRLSSCDSRSNGHDESRGPGHLPGPFDALVHLTPSERRVLFHMMEGRSAADIAGSLVVSVTTVRSHIRSILRKLNVNSQLAAVALAFGIMLDQVSAG